MNSDKLSLQPRNNHMAMLGAFGVLPGEAYGIDRTVMNATMHAVWELWEWESTWSCAPHPNETSAAVLCLCLLT